MKSMGSQTILSEHNALFSIIKLMFIEFEHTRHTTKMNISSLIKQKP